MKKSTDTILAVSADYRQFIEELEFFGLRRAVRARRERPGGPAEISRG